MLLAFAIFAAMLLIIAISWCIAQQLVTSIKQNREVSLCHNYISSCSDFHKDNSNPAVTILTIIWGLFKSYFSKTNGI